MRASLHDLLWGAAHVERAAVTWRAPLRAAIVTTALVATTIAVDRPELAVPLGVGSLFAGVADIGEEPGQRWRTLLWTTTWISVAALAGGLAADARWFEPLIAAAVALPAGFAGAAGRRPAIIGLLALVVFTVAAGRPDSPVEAVDWALLIALGGLVQAVVCVGWPLLTRPHLVFRRWQEAPAPLMPRLRAHWHWSDAFAQHAMRLALAIAVASVIAAVDTWPHDYWIPMTVAWVARPDQHGTVTRVFERVLGTIVGIAVSVALIEGLRLTGYGLAGLVGVSAFVALAFLWANYPIAVVGITATVLTLFALEGDFVGETIVIRLAATIVGGLIAIGAGLLWMLQPGRH